MGTAKFKIGMLFMVTCLTTPLAAQSYQTKSPVPHRFQATKRSPATPQTAATSAPAAMQRGVRFQLTDPIPGTSQKRVADQPAGKKLPAGLSQQSSRRNSQTAVVVSHFSDESPGPVANAFQPSQAKVEPQFENISDASSKTALPPQQPTTHRSTTQHQFTDLRLTGSTGVRSHFSDAASNGSSKPASISMAGPLQPIGVAAGEVPGLRLQHISGARFTNPQKFLKQRSFNFANLNQFLDKKTVQKEAASRAPYQFASSQKKRNPRQTDDAEKETNIAAARKRVAEDDDLKRLSVADVHAPISLNPFGGLEQIDSSGILQDRLPVMFANAPAGTYSELTGNYFQAHLAIWKAHQLYHHPLYFEETNLERYGNQLCYQNVASTVHFFASAALLPYKIGQSSPNTCVTTLGHHRPGECVPYRVHRGERSRRGMIYQALPIIAISL